jgi:hypothetical protein
LSFKQAISHLAAEPRAEATGFLDSRVSNIQNDVKGYPRVPLASEVLYEEGAQDLTMSILTFLEALLNTYLGINNFPNYIVLASVWNSDRTGPTSIGRHWAEANVCRPSAAQLRTIGREIGLKAPSTLISPFLFFCILYQ